MWFIQVDFSHLSHVPMPNGTFSNILTLQYSTLPCDILFFHSTLYHKLEGNLFSNFSKHLFHDFSVHKSKQQLLIYFIETPKKLLKNFSYFSWLDWL